MPTENEMRQLRLIQRIRAPLLTPDAETRQAVIDAVWREAGDSDDEILMALCHFNKHCLRSSENRY